MANECLLINDLVMGLSIESWKIYVPYSAGSCTFRQAIPLICDELGLPNPSGCRCQPATETAGGSGYSLARREVARKISGWRRCQ